MTFQTTPLRARRWHFNAITAGAIFYSKYLLQKEGLSRKFSLLRDSPSNLLFNVIQQFSLNINIL